MLKGWKYVFCFFSFYFHFWSGFCKFAMDQGEKEEVGDDGISELAVWKLHFGVEKSLRSGWSIRSGICNCHQLRF